MPSSWPRSPAKVSFCPGIRAAVLLTRVRPCTKAANSPHEGEIPAVAPACHQNFSQVYRSDFRGSSGALPPLFFLKLESTNSFSCSFHSLQVSSHVYLCGRGLRMNVCEDNPFWLFCKKSWEKSIILLLFIAYKPHIPVGIRMLGTCDRLYSNNLNLIVNNA